MWYGHSVDYCAIAISKYIDMEGCPWYIDMYVTFFVCTQESIWSNSKTVNGYLGERACLLLGWCLSLLTLYTFVLFFSSIFHLGPCDTVPASEI